MAETLSLPVLPLDDNIVLPTMVVPLDLSAAEPRAAIEAAQLAAAAAGGDAKAQVLLVPRPEGSYSPIGTLAAIEQVGRLPSGERAAVVRGTSRVLIGTGTVGPGQALWVEGTVIDEPEASPQATELAREYRGLAATILQKRGAWQFVDSVQRLDRPVRPCRPGRLRALPVTQKGSCWRRRTWPTGCAGTGLGQGAPGRAGRERDDPQGRRGRHGKAAAGVPAAPAARRDPQGTRRAGRQARVRGEDYRARVEAAELPEKVREAALSEVDKLERTSDQSPEAAGSAPGWTRCSTCRGTCTPRTAMTSPGPGRSWTPTTRASDVKDRIVEYLAVRKRGEDKGLKRRRRARRSGAVLALVGPPGVGKTSLGESVARAMGRKFVRVALGGVRDEAEIRATAAPTSARCPAGSSGPSARPVR